jgi:hypothetical protein
MASSRRQQGTIRGTKLRPRHLATEDLELVTKDEQLDVLDVQPAATANERSQQRPEREVEKREGHGRRSSQPAHDYRDTTIGALHGSRAGRSTCCRHREQRHALAAADARAGGVRRSP